MAGMYARLRRALFAVPAESAHRATLAGLRLLSVSPVPALLWWRLGPRDPVLAVRVLGLEFPSPVCLAAGFDKDARAYRALAGFGFGAVEVGTVTPRPQSGNPRPRLFRLPADRALINRMGFNNRGAHPAAVALRRRPRGRVVVGANIGKNKDTPEEAATADYVTGARTFAGVADYLVVNVSSPNTPGLRDLQATARLRPLLAAVREALDQASPRRRVPLLVKIAPDLPDEDVDAVAALAVEVGLDGIIAVNTTTSRTGLATAPGQVAAIGSGGLSGPPLKPRALEVLRRLRAVTGGTLVLISAGGIETAEDAWDRLQAGAHLIQAYTGIVYGGPLWAWRLNKELAARAHREGMTCLPSAPTLATGTDSGGPESSRSPH
jgi:dihydroorotate dehydrogenase